MTTSDETGAPFARADWPDKQSADRAFGREGRFANPSLLHPRGKAHVFQLRGHKDRGGAERAEGALRDDPERGDRIARRRRRRERGARSIRSRGEARRAHDAGAATRPGRSPPVSPRTGRRRKMRATRRRRDARRFPARRAARLARARRQRADARAASHDERQARRHGGGALRRRSRARQSIQRPRRRRRLWTARHRGGG